MGLSPLVMVTQVKIVLFCTKQPTQTTWLFHKQPFVRSFAVKSKKVKLFQTHIYATILPDSFHLSYLYGMSPPFWVLTNKQTNTPTFSILENLGVDLPIYKIWKYLTKFIILACYNDSEESYLIGDFFKKEKLFKYTEKMPLRVF